MNTNELTVYIDRPPTIVELISVTGGDVSIDNTTDTQEILQKQQTELTNLCTVLNGLVENVNSYCEQLFTQHRQAIAKLAVEIAAKILAKKIDENDYKIEEIVKNALEKIPANEDLKINLNPKDYSQIQNLLTAQPDTFKGINFFADPNVAPAECIIQTPKAFFKSMIAQQLEKIASALENPG